MKLQEIRNKMWVTVNGRPTRLAKDEEIRRWAAQEIVKRLQASGASKFAKTPKAS